MIGGFSIRQGCSLLLALLFLLISLAACGERGEDSSENIAEPSQRKPHKLPSGRIPQRMQHLMRMF